MALNLVYLIGNGFDVNLGLKTRFTDFLYWYLKQESKSEAIKALKEDISQDFENWSDLEKHLGEYCENFKDEQTAIEVYNDLLSALKTYISDVEAIVEKYTPDARKVLIKDLFHPERFFMPQDTSEIKLRQNDDIWKLQIITFNYTNSIEKILGTTKGSLANEIGDNKDRIISAIHHIHGTTSEKMILGVNDNGQIKNENLINSRKVLRRFVKPTHNSTYRDDHENRCFSAIDNASIICMYGLSIGETDKLWWNKIVSRLGAYGNSILLIIYYLPDFIPEGNYGPDYQDYVDEIKDKFLSNAGVATDANIRNRIYVTFNRLAFDIKAKLEENDLGDAMGSPELS